MPDEWIRQWGDPVLRQPARRVTVFDDLLAMQARRMCERLIAADGAGLAATQIGVLRRMFVYREHPGESVDVLVNPRVVAASAEQATFLEGCLSFNTIAVAVMRPAAVRVVAQDLSGDVREIDGDGYLASLLQHEIDHLDGILTLDRADGQECSRAVAALLTEDATQLIA